MKPELKNEIAKFIESDKRPKSNLAPIPTLKQFKMQIKTDVDLATNLLKGTLEDILIEIKKLNEFQNENIGDLHSAALSLIAFLCVRWKIKQRKRFIP